MNEQLLDLLEVLMPLVVFTVAFVFKMGQARREELAHALHSVLTRLRAGEIDTGKAKELVLATGAVSESKIEKVLGEVSLRLDDNDYLAIYKDNVIPGVGISVNTDGSFAVDATGVLNKSAHKIDKWLKKKAGIKIF